MLLLCLSKPPVSCDVAESFDDDDKCRDEDNDTHCKRNNVECNEPDAVGLDKLRDGIQKLLHSFPPS